MESEKVFVHLNPVWRERADFIIGAKCSTKEGSATREWEQLWSRQLADNRFEICCIPFFVYDLALGDEVETGPDEWGRPYMVQRVIKPSGHYTFRVWFGDSPTPSIRDEVCAEIERLGCLMEWYSINLIAIDAASDGQAQVVADLLWQREQLEHLIYETGRTGAQGH
jgi:hypothetical protein